MTGPVRLIRAISRAWALGTSDLAALLAYPETLMPDLLEGRTAFVPNADTANRLRIMYFTHAELADIFLEAADEARWLRDVLPLLGNLSPLDCMLRNGIPGIVQVGQVAEGMARR